MKKMLSIILISAMLSVYMPCAVFAKESAELENAVLTAKGKIEIPEEYSEFSSDSFTDGGETVYNLYWSVPADEYSYGKEIFVSVNSHGDITEYYRYEYKEYSNELRFSEYAEEDIKNRAKEWLFSVNPSWEASLPDEAVSLNAEGLVRDTDAYVFFERRINGLPFCSDFAAVSVDTLTGEIVSLSASWTYTDEIPPVTEAIPFETAEDIFFEKSPLSLSYMIAGDGAVLVYKPENEGVIIDAQTGGDFNYFSRKYSVNGYAEDGEVTEDSAAMGGISAGSQLTESEIKNIAENGELLSEAELRSAAENMPNTGIKDLTFISISYEKAENDGGNSRYIAGLYYESPDDNGRDYAYISFDAKTGELISFTSYSKAYEEEKTAVSYEKAVKTAEAFVKEYGGEAAKKTENVSAPPAEEQKIYRYILCFDRFENGIPCPENSISIRIDSVTGNVIGYSKVWDDDLSFELPDGIITPETAGQKLMEKSGMVLSYAPQQGESKTTPVIGMAYMLNLEIPPIISAKTGEILDYFGNVYVFDEKELRCPEDISGHYAETAVTKLIESGFLTLADGETKFRPDEPITQKDLAVLAYGLKYGDVSYPADSEYTARCIRNLEREGIKIEPEETAAREFGVQVIVSVLGYGKTAGLNGIFKTAFTDESDISPEYLGCTAIAQGLKLISGDENGCFKPQELLTRADTAVMIYNYLARQKD